MLFTSFLSFTMNCDNVTENLIEDSNKVENLEKKSIKEKPIENFFLGNEYKRKCETRDRIIFNIRGVKYDIIYSVFEILPNSRLSTLIKLYINHKNNLNSSLNFCESNLLDICDGYNSVKNEFYFNKDPHVFNIILNYLNYKKLHIDENICFGLILDEFKFWNIDIFSLNIDICCQLKLKEKMDIEFANKMMKDHNTNDEINFSNQLQTISQCIPESLRVKVWNLMNEPRSSFLARVRIFKIVFMLNK
jgi:hypothetical protein